ncbi:hypothetical protein [Lunatibacter salilacus]|uniref:hypothetical protein n=1 Tax=Lunatibacter salilacus TaxID=2483804 RepID=UPI00131D26B4|nr:hypothetical protein [Lunatibacter salilacus]
MAHQMLKPYSFLLYLLSFITSFFLGMSYAGIIEAGKNQGLAGGAIVFGYGVIAAVIGLIISFIVSNKSNRKIILRLNIILALCIAGFYGYFHVRFLERQKEKNQEDQTQDVPRKPTVPAIGTAMIRYDDLPALEDSSFGLGMFSPFLSESNPLYFYNNPNLDKALMEHPPVDSITFKKSEYGGFDIATAPPYLVPEHLKLDYDVLYFKALSVTEDFVEIEVNGHSKQTAFVSKSSGMLSFWPDFFLSINSVEFLNSNTQTIYVKPLDHAGKVIQSYSFMKPLLVRQDWMYVTLLNDNFEPVGKGWVKWKENGELLISYSFFS